MAVVTIPYCPKDIDVHNKMEARRFSVLLAPRRFGKTTIAVNHVIKIALQSEAKGAHFAYIVPCNSMVKEAWKCFMKFLSKVPLCQFNESGAMIVLPNRSVIHLFPISEVARYRMGCEAVVFDEAELMPSDSVDDAMDNSLGSPKSVLFTGTSLKKENKNLLYSALFLAFMDKLSSGDNWSIMDYEENILSAEESRGIKVEWQS